MVEVKITCILLTFNEESDVDQCLRQFRPYIDHILVLDGESEDKTVEIAQTIADNVVVVDYCS